MIFNHKFAFPLSLLLLMGGLSLSGSGFAQDGADSGSSSQDEQPAIDVTSQENLRDDSGTTIVGERESPIGLYITPWRNAFSEQDIDRPPRLLQVDLTPIDREVLARQVEYYNVLSEAVESRNAPPSAGTDPGN